MNLYTLFYKDQLQRQGLIEANSMEKAEELGRKWCDEGKKKYIAVKDAILVKEGVAAKVPVLNEKSSETGASANLGKR
jgi:hypothetical protein